MGKEVNDFLVESLGHCFLCLSKISQDCNPLSGPESDSLLTSSINSLQYLAKYLQMDLKKVFTHGQNIPHHLLARMEKSQLKVLLCQNCSTIGIKLAKLIQQLEKVQLEIRSNLEIFRSKLVQGDKHDLYFTKVLRMLTNSEDISSHDIFQSKLKIMKVLRADAKQKCSSKLAKDPPRVSILKLTQSELDAQAVTNQSYFLANRKPKRDHIFLSNIKLEANSPINFGHPNEDYDENMEDSNTDAELDDDDDNSHSQFLTSSNRDLHDPLGDDDVTEEKTVKNNQDAPKLKYPCKYCDKEFHPASYHRHYKSAHARIQYKCYKYNKLLSDSCNLSRHLKLVHSKVRSHECHVCGAKFKSKDALKTHLKRLHSLTT